MLQTTHKAGVCAVTPARAFTLVELLVVVSIVALLMAILLPSLKKAREAGSRALCAANLHGIATASIAYAAGDRDEQAVPIHPLTGRVLSDMGAYDWGGKSGTGEPQGGNDPLSSVWGTQQGRGPGTRPLNEVVFKNRLIDYSNNPGPNSINWLNDTRVDLDIYRCPADRGFAGHHFAAWAESGLSSYEHYGTSYVGNTFWVGGQDGRSIVLSAGACFRPITSVPSPARTLYYLENCGRFAWTIGYFTGPTFCGMCLYPPDRLALHRQGSVRGWHGHAFHFSVSFIDGHADVVQIRGRQDPPPYSHHTPGCLGCPQLWGGSDPDQANEGHLALTVRGPGWQKDVFPGPLVWTNVPGNLNLISIIHTGEQ